MSRITRRAFNQSATAGAAALTALSASPCMARTTASGSASSAWAIAAIRCSRAFLTHKDCEVVAICDIYQPYLDFASKKIGTNPTQYRDYHKLLEHQNLDAVVVATPDHWHALHDDRGV